MAVSIEARQLGNGEQNNATLEASENFTSQWREGKAIRFTEKQWKTLAEYSFSIHSQIVIMDH